MKEKDFEIRREEIIAEVKEPFSVLYLSDFHFNGWSQKVAEWMVRQVELLSPDLILLGGDYVDTKRGLSHLDFFVKRIAERGNIFAIAGNHDYFFGIDKIRELLQNYGVQWIEKESVEVVVRGNRIQIDGNFISETKSDSSILCVHDPAVFNGNLRGYDVGFAGHLHGSQFVFWENEKGLYPGRFFYKWNVLQREKDGCLCYVSKGLGDTLPLRYNCKKDVLFLEVKPEDVLEV